MSNAPTHNPRLEVSPNRLIGPSTLKGSQLGHIDPSPFCTRTSKFRLPIASFCRKTIAKAKHGRHKKGSNREALPPRGRSAPQQDDEDNVAFTGTPSDELVMHYEGVMHHQLIRALRRGCGRRTGNYLATRSSS